MCGIVGIASRSPVGRPDRLPAMRDTMRHRGPDDRGEWWSKDLRVGLAQCRLAVVDLSPGGHQPMVDAAGECAITFNGEIYNHQELREALAERGHVFRSRSDTEVVLAAYREWGTECVSRFIGMFAFGLYDARSRTLFLARDRAGEKPLFYRLSAGVVELMFASELKALLADTDVPRHLDPAAFELYLTYGYVPGDACILKGFHKLRPGHAAVFELDTAWMRTWHYWRLPEPCGDQHDSGTDLEGELERLLGDAVKRQLVADVPVGILLSGGIDSSLVTAMAARVASAPVRTYTIAFPGHGDHDEGPHARLVAEHFGTHHTELVAEPATVDVLPMLARQFDEPIADPSIVPTFLVSRLVRADATVALGGDGGDELFGGYLHHSWILRQARQRRFVPRPALRLVREAAARLMPVGRRGRNHLIRFGTDLADSIAHVNVLFDRWTRRRLVAAPLLDQGDGAPEEYRAGLCRPGDSVLRQVTEADFYSTLADGYLVKVDRASMLTSLEVRSPWLDHRLVEFAFGRVPDRLRATETERKILPRRLAARLLPRRLDLSRKQGFSVPLASWFTGAWGAYVENVLAEADPGILNRAVIRDLLVGQQRGRSNTTRLFALVMFELWRREYGVTLT